MKVPDFAAKSLVEFFRNARELGKQTVGGVELTIYGMEVAAPGECLREECGSKARLRRNGSYMRQAIEGVVWILVRIQRFRCGSCGKTVSRPHGFLVPYRRFTSQLICTGVEAYGKTIVRFDDFLESYRSISDDLSVYEDACSGAGAIPNSAFASRERCSPVRTTVFTWIDFVCKRITKTVQQIEKELVLKGFAPAVFPPESRIKNLNAWKAGRQARYVHQQNKPMELDRLSYGLQIGLLLVGNSDRAEKLRTYFIQFGERCFDMLSDVEMVMPRTQTFEQPA